jgi:hypothetical protein
MRYYLDTEFNGFGGELLSLALVRDDLKESLYALLPPRTKLHRFVSEQVQPHLRDVPEWVAVLDLRDRPFALPHAIANFLKVDSDLVIVADWPDDIAYFCRALMVQPGEMVAIPGLKFEMHRVDAYPTRVAKAVQHNAWWDAVALRQKLIDLSEVGDDDGERLRLCRG